MIPLIVIVSLASLVCLVMMLSDGEDFFASFCLSVLVGLFAGFLCFIVLGLVGTIAHTGDHDIYKGGKVYLTNLADNNSVSGSFFLGFGTINNNPVYSWYLETAPNAYERFDANADESTIHYAKADEKPYYIETIRPGGKFVHDWTFDFNENDTYVTHRDFYVPKGSITNNYRLDAQ